MRENIRENISINYDYLSSITLIANKINVLIIGGGNAALIKAKSFIQKGFKVTVISKTFTKEFYDLKHIVEFIEEKYESKYIVNKHLIVIAINDTFERERIVNDCEKLFKIYINCSNFKDGIAITPLEVRSENLICSINSKGGNPKGLKLIHDEIKPVLQSFDGFVEFTTMIRNKVKGKNCYNDVLDFIFKDDFKFFYSKGKGKDILKLFYEDIF